MPRKTNLLADCFLRLPRMDRPLTGKNKMKEATNDFQTLDVPKDEENVFMSTWEEGLALLPTVCDNEDVDIIKLFMNLPVPALSEMTCPLTVLNIHQHQAGDHTLIQTALVQFANYPIKVINGQNLVLVLVCYRKDPNSLNKDDWKIYMFDVI